MSGPGAPVRGAGAGVGDAGSVAPGRIAPFWHWLRLRAPWLVIPPFLVLARPSPRTLLLGGALALLGCGLRSWAAGHIRKREALAVTGPYAYLRHPLYAGSLLLGLGVTIAASRLSFYVLFAVFFLVVYVRTVRCEDRVLEERFGGAFRHYRSRVRGLLPRLSRYRPEGPAGREPHRFALRRWLRNREYEAFLGMVAGMGALALKMMLLE